MKQGAVHFAQGSHKRFRSQSTQRAGQTGGHAPYLIACEDMRRAWPRAQTTETFGSRKPLRTRFGTLSAPCCQKNARVRARPCGRFRERCDFGNERSLVANGCEDAPWRMPSYDAPTAPPHALARFLAAAAENPSQTLATKRNRPRTQREGGPEGPPSLEARRPLKRARAISRGAVLRAGRSA